jgi:hypothetical protein
MSGSEKHRVTPERVDFTFMYAAHDAFRRDLERLTASMDAGRGSDAATTRRWAVFKYQLRIHHTVEDATLWPPLQQVATAPDEQAVLTRMQDEHAAIDPLLAHVDAGLLDGNAADPGDALRVLAQALLDHMRHEEEQALPLIAAYLGRPGWAAFQKAFRKAQGIRGLAATLPWLLEGATPETEHRVLAELPPPARLIFRRVWQPRYARTAATRG